MSDSPTPDERAHAPSALQQDPRLRHTFIAMLAAPVVMCVLIGAGYTLIDWQSGAFMIAVGLGLGAINTFIFKVILRKMAEAEDAPMRDEEEEER